MPKTRRYSIEIRDVQNKSVLSLTVDWTEEELTEHLLQLTGAAEVPSQLPHSSRVVGSARRVDAGSGHDA